MEDDRGGLGVEQGDRGLDDGAENRLAAGGLEAAGGRRAGRDLLERVQDHRLARLAHRVLAAAPACAPCRVGVRLVEPSASSRDRPEILAVRGRTLRASPRVRDRARAGHAGVCSGTGGAMRQRTARRRGVTRERGDDGPAAQRLADRGVQAARLRPDVARAAGVHRRLRPDRPRRRASTSTTRPGSAFLVGVTLMATAVPSLIVGLIAGVFVDRWDRRKVMMASNLLQAVVVATIPFLLGIDITLLFVAHPRQRGRQAVLRPRLRGADPRDRERRGAHGGQRLPPDRVVRVHGHRLRGCGPARGHRHPARVLDRLADLRRSRPSASTS